jgi:gamma-glutamylcyclotransferase (GGCT)/AIG2-like uncharacterized protein YtfP
VSRGAEARLSEGRARDAVSAWLFAYGTLMRGECRHRFLAGTTAFVGEAWAEACLLSLGSYPGMVEGPGRVRGELYRLLRPEVLDVLDREEGYNFERRLTSVTGPDGSPTRAWAYWYRGPRSRARVLPTGDWRSRWR